MPKTIDDYPTTNLPMPWATWIPNRRPEFKVHSDVGKAKNAVGPIGSARSPDGTYEYPVRGGVVYQLVDGAWVVRAVITPGTFKRDHAMWSEPRTWNRQPGITTVIQEHP